MTLLVFLTGLAIGGSFLLLSRYLTGYFESPSLADSVQWENLAAPNLIGCKDESFIAVWEITGPDLSFTTPERADSLASKVERLLDTMDGDTMLHVDTVRVPSTEYASPDAPVPPVASFLDDIRGDSYSSGEHFENRTFIALTISAGSSPASAWYSSLVYTGDYNPGSSYDEMVEEAQTIAREFQQYIPESLSPRRLEGNDLTSYLYLVMTGQDTEVSAPPEEFPSLRYLFAHEMKSGFEPKIGDKWYSVVSIWGYPEEVQMGVSEALHDVPFPYRYSNRLVGLDKATALSAIKSRTGKFQQEANDWLSLLSEDPEKADPNDLYKDDHAQEMAFETKEVERLVQGGSSLLHHTGLVVVWDEDKEKCNEKATEVKKHLRNVGGGFIVDQETGLATESLIGSWPGHGRPNPRRYLLLSKPASRLLPITGTYPGPRETPCSFYELDDGSQPPPLFFARTDQSVPYRFSPYGESGDVGHQAVIGPTGTGKSIFLGFQALRQLHFDGGRSILFDRGYSFAPLCEALGGSHYDLDEMNMGFQPFADIHQEDELRWAISWVSDICRAQGLNVSPTDRNEIKDTLETMAKRDTDYRTFETFSHLIGGKNREIAEAVRPFAGRGDVGGLLNAEEDHFRDDDFIVIELGSITSLDPDIFTPVLTYLFHKVETMLSADRPTHVVADEFFAFASESEQGREYVENALRTYRKKNAFVTIGSQSPADLIGEETDGILNSIKTRIMLPNPNARSPAERDAYRQIGINEEQIELISEAIPKRDYIAVQPSGSRKFDLGLDAELAFMTELKGLSLKDTARQIVEYKSRFGSTWIYEWLKARGFDDLASDAPLDKVRADGRRQIKCLPPPGGQSSLPDPGDPERLEGSPQGDGASSPPADRPSSSTEESPSKQTVS